MTEETTLSRIQTELEALKAIRACIEEEYKHIWKTGTAMYKMRQKRECLQKRHIKLQNALEVLMEFESEE